MELETVKLTDEESAETTFVPRTALGEKLLAIRERVIASGLPLLDPEEVERELAARRGGYQSDHI